MKKTYLQIIPLVWSIYNLYNRKNTSINTEWTIYFSWSDWFLTTKACCQLLPKPWVRPRRAAGGSTATLHPTGRWAQGDLNGCWGIADINGYHGMARQLLGKREYPMLGLFWSFFVPDFLNPNFILRLEGLSSLWEKTGHFSGLMYAGLSVEMAGHVIRPVTWMWQLLRAIKVAIQRIFPPVIQCDQLRNSPCQANNLPNCLSMGMLLYLVFFFLFCLLWIARGYGGKISRRTKAEGVAGGFASQFMLKGDLRDCQTQHPAEQGLHVLDFLTVLLKCSNLFPWGSPTILQNLSEVCKLCV